MAEDFTVEYLASAVDEDTVVVTAAKSEDWIRDHEAQILRSALENYPTQGQSSVLPSDDTTSQTLTLEYIEQLASGLQSSVDNVRTANSIILTKVNSEGYLAEAYASIMRNINTDFKLSYGEFEEDENRAKELKQVKDAINFFNRSIDIKKLIRDAISGTYLEGNYVMYLRLDKGVKPEVSVYPLSICYPSSYLHSGEPVLEFSIKNLKDKLRKSYKKTRKNKAVYFENLDKEVKANFPAEIYKGYRDNENEIRLDPKYTGIVRINNMGRMLGVSPLFACLKPLIVLENIQAADVSDSKARKKKIIFQQLSEKLLGNDGQRKGLSEASHAHAQLMAALSTSSSVYSGAPFVVDVRYVTPKATSEDTINVQKAYERKLLTSLGISYTDVSATVGAGKLGLSQVLRVIDNIGQSLQSCIEHFYEAYLEDNGMDPMMRPDIRILDAEQLDFSVRKELAEFAFNILNCSHETAMNIVGMSEKDERAKRIAENENHLEDIYFPRKTAYTSGGDEGAGRPSGTGDDEAKMEYDQQYTENTRE